MTTAFPGMFTSILPLEKHHKGVPVLQRRNIYIYSRQQDGPSTDPNLDACAHMFHSDRESVWGIVRQFGLLGVLNAASSLSHTVIFHGGPDSVRFKDGDEQRWFFLETGSKRLADGRGLHDGKIWDAEGRHIASTLQDGAIRLRWENEGQMKEMENNILAGKL